MNSKRINQLRRGRWLMLLLALLLMPVGLWAENYGLTVAGIEVTDANAGNVLGDVHKSVSYNPSTKTLTLKGASISSVSADENTELKVYLIGYNEIGGNNNDYAFDYEGDAASLTFETSAVFPGTLTCFSANLARTENVVYNTGLNLESGEISVAKKNLKPVYFAGYVSNEGTDNYLYAYGGDFFFTKVDFQESTPIVSTNEEETTAAMWPSSLADPDLLLKVYFQFDWGECNNKAVTLQLKGMTEGEEDGQIYSSPISLSTANEDGLLEITLNKAVTSDIIKLVLSSDDAFSFVPLSVGYKFTGSYDITVANTPVTEQNKNNVLGDGTVSYDPENNILTLNGATIGNDGSDPEPMEACGISYSGTEDLTISLKGTNVIYGMGGCEAIRYDGQGEVTPKLIFDKGDDKNCSLQMNAGESTSAIAGFSEIQGVWGLGATDNGLAIIAEDVVRYSATDGLELRTIVNYSDVYVTLSSTLIASYYGLTISGIPVYEGNKESITGEGIYGTGTASFEPTTNTLTLNNVNLNPDYAQNDGDLRVSIVTSLAQLNINLIGESQTYAIKTTNENGTLTFESAEANRGAARLNFWYNADPYFIGYGENKVTYNDCLCMRADSYNSSFPMIVALNVPQVVTNEKESGLYYPDHEFTFALEEEVEGFDIYYANMLGGDPVKTTDGKFTLAEGSYTLRVYPIYPGMDTEPGKNWQFSSEISAKVIEKPTFSVDAATVYNDDITIFLQNVPEQDKKEGWISDNGSGTDETIMVPQVWYYLNDNQTDSIRYNATTGIPVTESCKVSVYIIDVDSAKKLKSIPVEAEYTVIAKTQLNISYGENSREWASYYADEKSLETPEGLQAYVVTNVNEGSITTTAIDYIPQNVGVLLKRTAEEIEEPIMAKAYMETESEPQVNLLSGTATSKSISTETGTVYVLYNDGFTRAYKGNIPDHRAYLVLNNVTAGARLSIFEDENATGIGTSLVNTEKSIADDEVYDLQGRRINNSTLKKGLYIVKGQKKVVK